MDVYHRGDPIILYTRFKDNNGNFVAAGEVMVRILHESNGNAAQDLAWTNMECLSPTEYYYTWQVPLNAEYGFYEITYQGLIGTAQAEHVEEFHVVGTSDEFSDMVKLYGYIHQSRVGTALIDVEVVVVDPNTNDEVYRTYTDDGGLWNAHVYPGQYSFIFNKVNFESVTMIVQVNAQNDEIQFDNVVLNPQGDTDADRGTGVFTISDRYTTKDGNDLVGLSVSAASVFDPKSVIASTYTDDDGNWELYLDPGLYLLHITGSVFENTYDKLFRLRVDEEGKASFDDITQNIATIAVPNNDEDGNGIIKISDQVTDGNGNPIVDVIVTAAPFTGNPSGTYMPNHPYSGDVSIPAAQTVAHVTTDEDGTWTMLLNTGTYVFTYSISGYQNIQELRIIEAGPS